MTLNEQKAMTEECAADAMRVLLANMAAIRESNNPQVQYAINRETLTYRFAIEWMRAIDRSRTS